MPKKKSADHNRHSEQSKRFLEAARELGCDNSEEVVDEIMKRVASSPPPRKNEKPDSEDGSPERAKPTKAKSR